jgi:Mn2+/Fe2+ NRAMP family transporter
MSIFIGMMFTCVLVTVFLIGPDWSDVLRGITFPKIPHYLDANGREQGVMWTLGLMGGVGGTLTLLSYGYWIREKGREHPDDLNSCRIDLGIAYVVTALFGMSMVIIASNSTIEHQSTSALLLVALGDQLKSTLGNPGRLVFLIGAWAAIFTSMLGVWQSVPYLFADFWSLFRKNDIRKSCKIDTRGRAYRTYLIAMAIIPLIGLQYKFVVAQKIYAVLGSLVIPMLATVLLILNSRIDLIGRNFRNRRLTMIALAAMILFFLFLGIPKILSFLANLV